MTKKFLIILLIQLQLIFTFGCSNNEKKEDYLEAGIFSFSKPDNNIWNLDSPDILSKFYPKYKEDNLTIIPVTSFSTKKNNGVIIISKIITDGLLSSSLKESQEKFKNKNKQVRKTFEDSYIINGLNFKHYLFDTKVTFTRIYVTNNIKNPTDALIIDFICQPDQYQILSSSFKSFILSFK